MSTTLNDTPEQNEAPQSIFSGLMTRMRKKFSRAKPAAGSPENFTADDIHAHTNARVEPSLDKDAPAADNNADNNADLYAAFLNSVAQIWQQDKVDPAAFENIKHLSFGQESEYEDALLLVNQENVRIYCGVKEENGDHMVSCESGDTGISPQTALDQVLVAMTDDLMRSQGIDEVFGSDLDKALLCLAAEKNGLKINNMPALSDDVKAQAAKLWADAFAAAPQAAAAAPTTTATPQKPAETTTIDNAELLPADQDAQASAQAASPQEIIDMDFKDVTPAIAPVATPLLAHPRSDVAIPLGYVDYDAQAAEVKPETAATAETPLLPLERHPLLGYEPEAAPVADLAPVALAAPAAPAARSWKIKPDTLALLAAADAKDSVNPETFAQFVDDLKSGQFSDAKGMLAEQEIRQAFPRAVGDTTEADILLQAALVQGVVYNAAKTASALCMTVNPHVASPVTYDPSRKASTLYKLPEAPTAAADANSILAEAGIGRETYDKVKAFVETREGDIVRARDLVAEFAAVGVGSNRARQLLSALQADGVTEPEESTYRVVRRAQVSPSA